MIRKLAIAILISVVFCSATVAVEDVPADRAPDTWAPVPFPVPDKEALRTLLTLRKERPMKIALPEKIVAGKPCKVKITLANDTKEVIYGPNAWHDVNVSILIVNSKGAILVPTQYGKQALVETTLANGLSEGSRDDYRGGVRIEPGQKHIWTIDVAKCFDLPPDTYTARISIVSLHPGEFVKFEVLPQEARFDEKVK